MAKPKPQPTTNRQFNVWIHPDLTIPVDDNSFIVDIPEYQLQHLGTHNLPAYQELPMFPFTKTSEQPATQE